MYLSQDIKQSHKSRDLEYLHYFLIGVDNHHITLRFHHLLHLQQHTQSCRGYILKLFQVKGYIRNALDLFEQLFLYLRNIHRVNFSDKLNIQLFTVRRFFVFHNSIPLSVSLPASQ